MIVIIGITIAFSMNKCSENSKEVKLKNQYLENLRKDITINKNTLVENIIELNKKSEQAKNILQHLNSDEKMSIISDVFQVSSLVPFNIEESTYHTLINSGDLSLINDLELKTAIQKHYNTYELIKRDYQRQEAIQKKYLADYYIYEINYADFGKNIFPFKNERLLFNIIQSKSGAYMLQISASKKGVDSCNDILQILDEALK